MTETSLDGGGGGDGGGDAFDEDDERSVRTESKLGSFAQGGRH